MVLRRPLHNEFPRSIPRRSAVVAEWSACVHSTRGAIALTEGLDWPEFALRMQILDEKGRLVHRQTPPGDVS